MQLLVTLFIIKLLALVKLFKYYFVLLNDIYKHKNADSIIEDIITLKQLYNKLKLAKVFKYKTMVLYLNSYFK